MRAKKENYSVTLSNFYFVSLQSKFLCNNLICQTLCGGPLSEQKFKGLKLYLHIDLVDLKKVLQTGVYCDSWEKTLKKENIMFMMVWLVWNVRWERYKKASVLLSMVSLYKVAQRLKIKEQMKSTTSQYCPTHHWCTVTANRSSWELTKALSLNHISQPNLFLNA